LLDFFDRQTCVLRQRVNVDSTTPSRAARSSLLKTGAAAPFTVLAPFLATDHSRWLLFLSY